MKIHKIAFQFTAGRVFLSNESSGDGDIGHGGEKWQFQGYSDRVACQTAENVPCRREQAGRETERPRYAGRRGEQRERRIQKKGLAFSRKSLIFQLVGMKRFELSTP